VRTSSVLRLILGLLVGALVGGFGTAIHRTIWGGVPLGLLIALLLVLSAALCLRAAAGFGMFAAMALGWILAILLLWLPNAGGDFLFIDHREAVPWSGASLGWIAVGSALLVLVALLPPRWFISPETLDAGGRAR